jgi:hypothetical protein
VFTVQTDSRCAWTASTPDSWIQITSSTGTGPGELMYTVERNSGAARTGTISVGETAVRVEQEGRRPERVTLNGSISSLTGTCPTVTFTLGNRTVFTDASTRFRDSCSALATGTAVRVDGEEAASGQVYATTVDAR